MHFSKKNVPWLLWNFVGIYNLQDIKNIAQHKEIEHMKNALISFFLVETRNF